MSLSEDRSEALHDLKALGTDIHPQEKPTITELSSSVVRTPWDARAFGIDTYEIRSVTEDVLQYVAKIPGHFTVKVDPLSPKGLLHKYGFYYCDTLIQPYCTTDRFVNFEHEAVSVTRTAPVEDLIAITHGAFSHGRFNRDFNLDSRHADLRYDLWLQDLYKAGTVLVLLYEGKTAGFFGFVENRIVLHALGSDYMGRGLAKYFWSAACKEIFRIGHSELISSISAANLPVLNLYVSLGFRFKNPLDVYHRLNK